MKSVNYNTVLVWSSLYILVWMIPLFAPHMDSAQTMFSVAYCWRVLMFGVFCLLVMLFISTSDITKQCGYVIFLSLVGISLWMNSIHLDDAVVKYLAFTSYATTGGDVVTPKVNQYVIQGSGHILDGAQRRG